MNGSKGTFTSDPDKHLLHKCKFAMYNEDYKAHRETRIRPLSPFCQLNILCSSHITILTVSRSIDLFVKSLPVQ